MLLSVVVPVLNEADNIPPLVAEIDAALSGLMPDDYEIVYVDDGSDDASVATLRALQATRPYLRVVRHERRCGQSAAVRSGVKAARGAWIATLDGDGQNDPADIPTLWAAKGEAGPDAKLILGGWRVNRKDTWRKRMASKIGNKIRRGLLKDGAPDTGCGLKLFPRALFLDLPYFDHMHRYLGALVIRQGGRMESVPVNHRPRQRGVSKYGVLDRLLVAFADLVGVMWLMRRGSIPTLRQD